MAIDPNPPAPGEVTRLLRQMQDGSQGAANDLIPLVYRELRRIAGAMMRKERAGHTLQPTAVVHEAWIRLVDVSGLDVESRAHFFAIAAKAMHQVLVDHARRKQADKRGGEGQQRVELDDDIALTEQESVEVLAVHEALDRLAKLDPRQSQMVEMQYFAGNSVEEIAAEFKLSVRTAKRELQTGRLFLKEQLSARGVDLP